MRKLAWMALSGFLVLSCSGQPVEESVDEDVWEATTEGKDRPVVRLDSVRTSEGKTQIRMGDTVELVMRGDNLQAVRSVRLGDFTPGTAVVTRARRTEVRARLEIQHGAPTGLYSVTVDGPRGSATLADAIEMTPYVVAPGSPPGGRGTFESPLSLCDDEVEGSAAQDLILLLAGEHRCDDVVDLSQGGQAVVGGAFIGAGDTIVRGASGSFGGFVAGLGTSFEALTIVAPQPAAGAAIVSRGPGLRVRLVELVGAGIRIEDDEVNVTFADLFDITYTGSGTGIQAVGAVFLEVWNSHFTGCATGVALERGRLNLFESTIVACDVGVHIVSVPATPSNTIGAQLVDLTLRDNRIGLLLEDGAFHVVAVDITDDETTPAGGERGVVVHNGSLVLGAVNISGQAIAGVDAAVLGGVESRLDAQMASVSIEGGQYGVRLHGPGRRGSMTMTETTIRDQTVASVSLAIEEQFILGMDGVDNALSAVSGFALEDLRQDALPDNFVVALTPGGPPFTLNGRSYTELGLVSGPISVPPDFRILHESGSIHF